MDLTAPPPTTTVVRGGDRGATPPLDPRRKVRTFPPELEWVTDQDRKDFVLAMEVDTNKKSKTFGEDQLVAQSVTVRINHVDRVVDLNSLVVDHLRRLCKNLGVTHMGSLSKFEIRKAIARYFQGLNTMEQSGVTPTTVASRRTSTILRLVNVIFSERFIEDLLKVNDAKLRQDHETFRTNKDFWIRAAIAHNSCVDSDNDIVVSPPRRHTYTNPCNSTRRHDTIILTNRQNNKRNDTTTPEEDNNDATSARGLDDESQDSSIMKSGDVDDDSTEDEDDSGDEYSTLIIPEGDEFLRPLKTDREINLRQVNQFETNTFRGKVLTLFKMRQAIQQNMSVSGTHNHVVWDFVEGGLQKKGSSGGTKIALYYFYMRCEEVPDIDAHFQPFMDASMIGDTSAPLDDSSDASSARKKRTRKGDYEAHQATHVLEAHLEKANENQAALLECLAEATQDRKRKMALTKKTMGIAAKNNKFDWRLQLAKALNDKDELKLLLDEVKSGSMDNENKEEEEDD